MGSKALERQKVRAFVVLLCAVLATIVLVAAPPAEAQSARAAQAPAPAPDRTIHVDDARSSTRDPAFASSGRIFADPDIVRVDSELTDTSRYHMYSTNICGMGCITVPYMTTTDFGTYTPVVDAMPNGLGQWADHWATWAPEVHQFGSKWALYYTARVKGTTSTQCIGRATAWSPAGPFIDTRPAPVVCTNAPSGSGAGGAIDADVFVDDHGTPFLLWKNDGNNPDTCGCDSKIWSRQLNSDGSAFVGSPRALISNGGDYTVEAPELIQGRSGLSLLYSAGHYGTTDYRTAVANCAGPLGPCSRTGPTLFRSGGGLVGPGGASAVTDRVGRTWLAYHSGPVDPDQRRLQIDAIRFDPTGPVRVTGAIGVNDPWGGIDAAYAVPGGIAVQGWAIDPDGNVPAQVQVSVLNSAGAPIVKDVLLSDLAHPGNPIVLGTSASRGFSSTVSAMAMPRTVCIRAERVGSGANKPSFGCATVEVRSGNPFGSLDSVTGGPGTVGVSGWTIDPDTAAPIAVDVWAGGQFLGTTTAGGPRGDVGAGFPGYGPDHAFNATLPAPTGVQQICVYAINTGPGTANPRFACRTVTVTAANPFGSLDAVTPGPGTVTVSGWTIDPNTTGAVDIHVWAGGQLLGTASAGAPRGDIGAAYPMFGPHHGYNATFAAPPGVREICVYAINVGPGTSNPRFPCRTVTVPS